MRHVLPVYPLFALAFGVFLAAWWARGGKFRTISVVLTLVLLLEGVAIHPHYLANFNLGAGGPDGGYKYLVDCNLDWGQDLPALAEYQNRKAIDRLVFSYFGTDDPEKYGITYDLLCPPLGGKKPPPGIYAVSATNRQGLYLFPNRMEQLAWFRGSEPTHVVAHTMLIFDLRD